jgi:hypothetical protein
MMMPPPPPSVRQQAQQPQRQVPDITSDTKPRRKGFGLLGNLVGAQKRTNLQVVSSSTKPTTTSNTSTTQQINNQQQAKAMITVSTSINDNDNDNSNNNVAGGAMTSGQVLSEFRNEMEQQMLDFDISPEMSMKVSVKLSDHVKKVQDSDKDKVTMEVLKYIVYEAAEEVNEEWIAHKEPSEFMDECTIAIYKDPEEAPSEALEELNRAEIPEEMKAQQKMAEQQRRQQEIKALRDQEQLQKEALKQMAAGGSGNDGGDDDNDNLAVLNTQKRDRRTIEDYQREAKRFKGE